MLWPHDNLPLVLATRLLATTSTILLCRAPHFTALLLHTTTAAVPMPTATTTTTTTTTTLLLE